jgi:choline-sulfatase
MRDSHLSFRLALLLLLLTWSATSLAQSPRPNFLFILTDDQSPETLACYANTVCHTPNLDRLAAEGMILHDAHHMGAWAGAVCTASRTMIMTGRTVWNIPGAKGPGLEFPRTERKAVAQQSLPAVFNRAGYKTFRTCKQGNSFNEANELFAVSRIATKREGTAEGGSQWHGDQVMEYLEAREAAGDTDPFLIYYGFSHPHDPRNARPELAKKYGAHNDGPPASPDENAPPLPPNYLPAHPFPHGHPGLRDEEQVQGVLTRRDEATVRNEIGREYACIEDIDRQVGRVLDKLEAMGQLDNTYVFYTSDHGIAVGRHGLMGKQNLYEHTWRVPFIVRGPGIEPGSEASGYIYLLDLLPTLCDLAGIEVPAVVEGQSFRPVLEGKAERIRDVLYGVYSGGTKPGMRAVKSDGWKLIEYDVLDGTVRKTQLFDLRSNPREFLEEHHSPELRTLLGIDPMTEQVNLADSPAAAVKRRELQQLLAAEMRRLGDPYTLSAN